MRTGLRTARWTQIARHRVARLPGNFFPKIRCGNLRFISRDYAHRARGHPLFRKIFVKLLFAKFWRSYLHFFSAVCAQTLLRLIASYFAFIFARRIANWLPRIANWLPPLRLRRASAKLLFSKIPLQGEPTRWRPYAAGVVAFLRARYGPCLSSYEEALSQ